MNKHDSIIDIKLFPALNGDCILVSFGKSPTRHIMIDCGYPDTFSGFVLEELSMIKKRGECLEKLVISHIDSDHISGAIPFLIENKTLSIPVKEIWHNTYRHLEVNAEGQKECSDAADEKILNSIISRGYRKVDSKTGANPISAKQGTTLGALILEKGYNWNTDFDGAAVSIDNKQQITIDNNANIYLLSPNQDKLANLKNYWKNELAKYDFSFSGTGTRQYDDAFEMPMSWEKESPAKKSREINSPTIESLAKSVAIEDKSVTNGSSIAFILEIRGKKLLFLADSHPGLIVKSLQKYSHGKKILFDSIKLSHHGSFKNISRELLELIDAPVYLFSTNGGQHNHPDKETIAHVVHRKTTFTRRLYFNYRNTISQFFDRADWMQHYNYMIHYLDESNYTISL